LHFLNKFLQKNSKNNLGKGRSLKTFSVFWQNFAPKRRREGMLVVIFNFLMATIL
jgi:hypothetical protein